MMCEKMFLDRISAQNYLPYIQEAAKIKWAKELQLFEVDRILELSETHPFYVNYLCSKLWHRNKLPTNKQDIDAAWQECLISEERRLIEELDKLTLNQRLLLKIIANTPNLIEPTAASFLAKIKMSSGTVIPIIKSLKKKDMIFVDQNKAVRVLDPLMRYLLITDSHGTR